MTKYRSPQLAKKRKEEFWTKVGLWFLLLNISFLCVAELSKLSFLNIKEISVVGNEVLKTSDIDNVVSEELKGNYLWLFFLKKNFLIYPNNKIEDKILDRFPRIKEIDLDLIKFKTLNIEVIEREPFALWCLVDSGCYLLDEKGLAFARAEEEDLFKYEIFVQHKEALRTQIFSEKRFKEINSFIDFLRGLNLEPYKFAKDGLKGYEIYFNQGSKIIFDETQEIRIVMENLQSVMNLEDFDLESIDYIDLRFGNKVFYK